MKHLHGQLVVMCKELSRSRLWQVLICITSTEKDYEYHSWAAGSPTETEHRDIFLNCQVSNVILCYPVLSKWVSVTAGWCRNNELLLLLLLLSAAAAATTTITTTITSAHCFDPSSAQAFYIYDCLHVLWGVFLVFFHGLYSKACYGVWIPFFRNVTLRHRLVGSRHFMSA